MRILMIEDDKKYSDALAQLLTKHRHMSDLAEDGEAGQDMAMSGIYHLILLDLMLPKRGGMEILRTIRSAGISTPVIVLSAKSESADKIAALDAGADDYLTQPYCGDELMARIRAIFRRGTTLCTAARPMTEDELDWLASAGFMLTEFTLEEEK